MITATIVNFNASTIIFFDSMTPESLLMMMFSILLIVGSIASSSRVANFFYSFFYRFITFILKAFICAFALLIAIESNLSSHHSFGALLFGWWIVASILSWIPWIQALILPRSFKLQNQINQESTVTKTLANLFSLGVGIAGFNDLSQDSPGGKHLIVVLSAIIVRFWLLFLFSSTVLFIRKKPCRARFTRRRRHKSLPGRFRVDAENYDHEEFCYPVRVFKSFWKLQVDCCIQDRLSFNKFKILRFWKTPAVHDTACHGSHFKSTTTSSRIKNIAHATLHRFFFPIQSVSCLLLEEIGMLVVKLIISFCLLLEKIPSFWHAGLVVKLKISLLSILFQAKTNHSPTKCLEEHHPDDIPPRFFFATYTAEPSPVVLRRSSRLKAMSLKKHKKKNCPPAVQDTSQNVTQVVRRSSRLAEKTKAKQAQKLPKNKEKQNKKNCPPAVQDTSQNVAQVLRRSSRLAAKTKAKQAQKLPKNKEKMTLRRSRNLPDLFVVC